MNNKIYALGGSNGCIVADTNYEYDPASNAWSSKASKPTAADSFSATAVNSKIYAIGGYYGARTANEEYDPLADTWATRTPMPTGRHAHAAASVNGKIYVVGGRNASLLATNEEYDPEKLSISIERIEPVNVIL